MTEDEWLACNDPGSLRSHSWEWERTHRRKVLLFGCACCRRIWKHLIHPASRLAVEVAERYAEGAAERSELDSAAQSARLVYDLAREDAEPFASAADPAPASYEIAAHAAYKVANPARPVGWPLMLQTAEAARAASGQDSEDGAQVALIRDIFGNPFRPVTFDPAWRTSTAVALAGQMYDPRDFSPMPILADALQDAGCDSDDILNHCRDPDATHVRGCWVVDLVLGKA
jgi:hypothetical protein